MGNAVFSPEGNPDAARILVVEDEGLIAMDLQYRLCQAGYRVAGVCDSGEEALRQAREIHPQLVLMDIQIKGDLDGIDVADKLKSQYEIPVIYLTARSDPRTLELAMRSDPDAFLRKPARTGDLFAAIELALAKQSRERALRRERLQVSEAFGNMATGAIVTDERGMVQLMNPAAESLTGWCLEDARNQHLRTILPLRDLDLNIEVDDVVTDAIANRNPRCLPSGLHSISRNMRTFAVDGEVAPCLDGATEWGAVITFRDATERLFNEREAITLCLPIGPVPAASQDASQRVDPLLTTVLLVEEEQGARKSMKGILEQWGYRCLEADRAEDGFVVAEMHRGPIDVLIQAVAPEAPAGMQLAQQVWRRNPGAKVLFVGDARELVGALEPGRAGWVRRPIREAHLLGQLEDLLRGGVTQ